MSLIRWCVDDHENPHLSVICDHVIPHRERHIIPHLIGYGVYVVELAITLQTFPHRVRRGSTLARRTFDVVDVTEILIHWYAGRSKLELSTSVGVDRKTIKKYVAAAEADGLGAACSVRSSSAWTRSRHKPQRSR